MKISFLTDKLNKLHLAMLKAVLLILAILPMSQLIISYLYQTNDSSQILLAFMSYTVLGTALVLAFTCAVQITLWSCTLAETRLEKLMFDAYKHIPMLLLVAIISFICLH